MLVFSERRDIVDLYYLWLAENKIPDIAMNFCTFLELKKLLNEENCKEYLKLMKEGAENE